MCFSIEVLNGILFLDRISLKRAVLSTQHPYIFLSLVRAADFKKEFLSTCACVCQINRSVYIIYYMISKVNFSKAYDGDVLVHLTK